MNFKLTQKELREQAFYIIGFSYCDIQELTPENLKIGFNAGVYGCNFEIYKTPYNNGLIVTGYRPISQNDLLDYYTKQKIKMHYLKQLKESNNFYNIGLNICIDFMNAIINVNQVIYCLNKSIKENDTPSVVQHYQKRLIDYLDFYNIPLERYNNLLKC